MMVITLEPDKRTFNFSSLLYKIALMQQHAIAALHLIIKLVDNQFSIVNRILPRNQAFATDLKRLNATVCALIYSFPFLSS
jgi:hypothetical protein